MTKTQSSNDDFDALLDRLHEHMRMESVPVGLGLKAILPHVRWRDTYRTILGYLDLYDMQPDKAMVRAASEALGRYVEWFVTSEINGTTTCPCY